MGTVVTGMDMAAALQNMSSRVRPEQVFNIFGLSLGTINTQIAGRLLPTWHQSATSGGRKTGLNQFLCTGQATHHPGLVFQGLDPRFPEEDLIR